MRNIVNDEKYMKERSEINQYFGEEYLKPMETKNIISPSGTYALKIYYYEHKEGNIVYAYSKGVLNCKNGKTVEIKRNYDHFQFCWIEEKDYFLCGADYQGYSIVDLKNGELKHYVPEEYYQGIGFCWVQVHYLHDNDIIAVEGCYWGAPYDIVFYDFSKPMELPYKELLRVAGYDTAIGWKNKRLFEYFDEETKEIKEVRL